MTGHELGTQRQNTAPWIGFLAFVGIVCWIVFGNLVNHPLDIHDADLFEDNISISEDFSHFFSPDKKVAGGRPLTELVRWAAYLAFGNDPKWFHLLGVFFHACSSILVAIFLQRLGATLSLSFITGSLFLVNVTHFQAVHWITGLDYPLALTIGLASLIFYASYQVSGGRHDWLRFAVGLTTATFAQPAIAVLLLFCFFWSWQKGARMSATLRSLFPVGVLLLAANLLVVKMTFRGFTTWLAIESNATKGIIDILLSAGHLLLWFLSRLATTAHWLPFPIFEHRTWEFVVGGIILTGLLLCIRMRGSLLALWAIWILLCIGPFILLTTDVVFTYGHLLTGGSRFLYFASVGSSAFLAWVVQRAAGRLAARFSITPRALEVCFTAILLASSFLALRKVEAISFYSAGRNYIARGEVARGDRELRRAIRKGGDAIPLKEAYVALIQVTMMQAGKIHELVSEARAALPESAELRIFELVVESLEASSNNSLQAKATLDQFRGHEDLRVPNLIAQTYHNRALGYLRSGEPERAVSALDRSLEFQPDRDSTKKLRARVVNEAADE
jgi:hypothetical protein